MINCFHGISLRILVLPNLVTRVLLSIVSVEILAFMRNVLQQDGDYMYNNYTSATVF